MPSIVVLYTVMKLDVFQNIKEKRKAALEFLREQALENFRSFELPLEFDSKKGMGLSRGVSFSIISDGVCFGECDLDLPDGYSGEKMPSSLLLWLFDIDHVRVEEKLLVASEIGLGDVIYLRANDFRIEATVAEVTLDGDRFSKLKLNVLVTKVTQPEFQFMTF